MSYITNVEEVVPALRERLRDYLVLKLDIEPDAKKIKCFVHEDSDPSMYFNPKTNDQTVHCFSCGAQMDIFAAAAHLEGLPENGSDWVKITIPHLAEQLEIPLSTGEPSQYEKEKMELYKLTQDIADIIGSKNINQEYLEERRWKTNDLTIGSVSEEELITSLLDKGWDNSYLITSLMIRTKNHSFFGDDKLTFVIRDARSRAIAFQSRNLSEQGPKYVNTPETIIYNKSEDLLALDTAISKGKAKQNGIYIVEGPGDVAQMHRVGIFNVAAACGTGFTSNHVAKLKMYGITKIYFNFDWDNAGILATDRILKKELKGVSGLSCWIVEGPEDKDITDVDELLRPEENMGAYKKLNMISAFEWLMQNMSDNQDPVSICEELIPSIAIESTAIQRDRLARILADYTHVSLQAIFADIESLRSGKAKERRERLMAATQKYMNNIETDPENIHALLSEHEDDIKNIETEYQKHTIGVNYQLARYDALQSKKQNETEDSEATEFRMTRYTTVKRAYGGGADTTNGVLTYLGGRPNSGKTATGIGLSVDIAMSDPDAIVITHFTDDNYNQVEPRFKSNIGEFLRTYEEPVLPIGKFVSPLIRCENANELALYRRADDKLRELIANEKLIIIDMEDGYTMSSIEKQLKYVRSRYPSKKVFVFSDNTHRYKDYPNLDQTSRLRHISDKQKELTMKYNCALTATVEYRKNMPFDTTKIKMPVDDDIADARALMYNPNVIIHVYNDLHDRKEAAEILWLKNGTQKEPRLMLNFSKNKIGNFKKSLTMDLDTSTVVLTEKDPEQAKKEYEKIVNGEQPIGYIDADL